VSPDRAIVEVLVREVERDPGLAGRLADALGVRTEPADAWLAPDAAAAHLGVTRKRVYDLTSSRALIPDGRDGRTPLYRRSTLDEYARRGAK
jgi:hypothetical protein